MNSARLYGHSLGEGSFVQVTRGFHDALESIDELAGFVAIDNVSKYDDEPPAGSLAPVAFNTGAPSAVALSLAMGRHKERWLMVAPNSDRIPRDMIRWFPKCLTGLLTPSTWGKSVIEALFVEETFTVPMPVVVCPHGVSAEFVPDAVMHAELERSYASGYFRALHLTSTNSERKGTKLLIEAWRVARTTKTLPDRSQLIIIAEPVGAAEIQRWILEQEVHDQVAVVSAYRRPRMTQAAMLRAVHLVIQPSRAEGFGLVPIEARASGVLVAATDCTGHAMHMHVQSALGRAVLIESGKDAPMDDMPGAKAPSVTVDAIALSLAFAYEVWPVYAAQAQRTAHHFARQWSWAAQTGPVIERIIRRASS